MSTPPPPQGGGVVLILQMGDRDEVGLRFKQMIVRAAAGGFSEVEICRRVRGEQPKLGSPTAYAGIVVSGSSYMVTDEHAWSVETAQWLCPYINTNNTDAPPILGVCYGHQLLCHALFPQRSDVGYLCERQIGSREIQLTEEAASDELFGALLVDEGGACLPVHVLHRQAVRGRLLPGEATVLATNAADHNHALRLGRGRCWTVQFHPEMKHEWMAHTVRQNEQDLLHTGGRYAECLRSVNPQADSVGRVLMDRFVEICLGMRKTSRL